MTSSLETPSCTTESVGRQAGVAQHLLVDLHGCDPQKLDNRELLERLVTDVAALAGTSLLETRSAKFDPIGVTVLGLLAESHVSIHTWPERGYAAADLMTCNLDVALDPVVELMRGAVGAERAEQRLVLRGSPRG